MTSNEGLGSNAVILAGVTEISFLTQESFYKVNAAFKKFGAFL